MFRVAESQGHHLRVMPRLLLLSVVLFQAPTSLVAQDLLYVASQEEVTVSVIDTRSNELLETVDLKTLGFTESAKAHHTACLLYTSPSPRDLSTSRMPSSA